ncbi:MAG TPA: hypothetical protein VFE02_18375 [Candidatus Acidoferrales bacterium]|nr:hypothetical protein [Candidatus Acidoferrales bacterium]
MDSMDDHFWIHLLPWRQKNKAETKSAQIKFTCQLAFTHENGWDYLELQLVNRSSWSVWVEEATIVLSDLDAAFQAALPVEQVKIKICQNVVAHNTVGVSLAAAIYEAAGSPQGDYACVVLCDVSYSVFEEWCNTQSRVYRVRMRGLTAVGLGGARGFNKNGSMSQRIRIKTQTLMKRR